MMALNTYIPAIHLGDGDGVPVSWLWPDRVVAFVAICGMVQRIDDLSVILPSNKSLKNFIII